MKGKQRTTSPENEVLRIRRDGVWAASLLVAVAVLFGVLVIYWQAMESSKGTGTRAPSVESVTKTSQTIALKTAPHTTEPRAYTGAPSMRTDATPSPSSELSKAAESEVEKVHKPTRKARRTVRRAKQKVADVTPRIEVREPTSPLATKQEAPLQKRETPPPTKQSVWAKATPQVPVYVPTELVIVHHEKASDVYRVKSVWYWLDDELIYERHTGKLPLYAEREVAFHRKVRPGKHTLRVKVLVRGEGYGIFTYLRKYQLTLENAYTFNVIERDAAGVWVEIVDRGGTRFQDRVHIIFRTREQTREQTNKLPASG